LAVICCGSTNLGGVFLLVIPALFIMKRLRHAGPVAMH
jgi:hypothetical protein